MNDPFQILGLPRGAGAEEAKRVYRRLVMQWHPDRNPAPEAEETFKRIKAAFELVSDPLRFAEWQAKRGRPRHSAADAWQDDDPDVATSESVDDPVVEIVLSLEEAALGVGREVELARRSTCGTCGGSGMEKFQRSRSCRHCQGCGRLRDPKGTTVVCGHCEGKGFTRQETCRKCEGLGLEVRRQGFLVDVPPGLLDGESLRLHARPEVGGKKVEIGVLIRLAGHALFELLGRDLHCRVPVSVFRLMAGGRTEVPTLAGRAQMELKPWPAHGLEYRLAGLGFPGRERQAAGDLRVSFEPVYPHMAAASARILLDRLEGMLENDLETQAPELARWRKKLAERRT